jgi:hypothetical protein
LANRASGRITRNPDVTNKGNATFRIADHPGVLRYTPFVHHEHALIAAFVKRSKRDRYREILSNPRLRHKFTDKLAHFSDFDPKYRLPIPSNKLFGDNIAFLSSSRMTGNPEVIGSSDGLVPRNAQASTNRRALPDGRQTFPYQIMEELPVNWELKHRHLDHDSA